MGIALSMEHGIFLLLVCDTGHIVCKKNSSGEEGLLFVIDEVELLQANGHGLDRNAKRSTRDRPFGGENLAYCLEQFRNKPVKNPER